MTVNEAIAAVGGTVGEAVSRETLLNWLFEIETAVTEEIAKSHEGEYSTLSAEEFFKNGERQLFATDPYSNLYIHYLIMKTDDALCDTERYLNSAARFSASYTAYADWYNRTYMPLTVGRIKV